MAISEAFIGTLNDLLALDYDAVDAYGQAIKRMKSDTCSTKLRAFQDDHRRHIMELGNLVSKYGGKARHRKDLKGVLMVGMTRVQAAMGDEMALRAMESNERITNGEYERAFSEGVFPDDVHDAIRRARDDEARHLAWIKNALATRAWEEARPPESPSQL